MSLPRLALLAASLVLAADSGGRAQLLPFGEFAARDGRPGPGKTWKVTDAQGTKLAAAMNAVVTKTPLVIDYEHQTLTAMQQGHKAPAAGWIKGVEWLSGQGMFATVDWTAPAKAHIDAGEYLYISPVITWDDDGTVTGVALAALTNFPGLLGMEPVVAALSAFSPLNTSTETRMELAALLTLLGLAANATDADITAKVTALKAQPVLSVALTGALGLAAGADEAAALSAITTLKGGDSSTLALVTQLQGQVVALTTQLNDGKVEALVDGAIAAGKFAPALRDALIGQGKANYAALSGLVDKAPVIPGLVGQSNGGQGRDTGAGGGAGNGGLLTALSSSQAAIADQLSIPHADYLKQLNQGRTAAA